MLIKEMEFACLMVNAQLINEKNTKKKERERKKARIGSFNFARPKLEGGSHSQFRPKSSIPALSLASAPVPKFKKSNKDKVPGYKSQGSISSARKNPLCKKYGKNHQGVCRAGSNVCFRCGKPNQKIKECP